MTARIHKTGITQRAWLFMLEHGGRWNPEQSPGVLGAPVSEQQQGLAAERQSAKGCSNESAAAPNLTLIGGARESAQQIGLHRPDPSKDRPRTHHPDAPTQRWCSDWGKERANVTGNSARTVELHPSGHLACDTSEAGHRRRTVTPVTLPNHAGKESHGQ